ncbi:hypothetical protein [Vibrio vulnificus]|uniref:hypothetical protein n=1 Tax=Vibrio vulnificus TaxID=672 RepID=UPI001FB00BF7|nr:hypothetical protein [Vibrio vulnificus]MCJ0804056.1 hypothetical protein [Vibrio vulnificus]
MKTGSFWETVRQMGMLTTNSCKVATSQGQETIYFERDQLRNLKKLCERELAEIEKATSRSSGCRHSEVSCEEFSLTKSQIRKD